MRPTESEAQERAQSYADHADLSASVAALRAQRDAILERWLEVVARQPFHHGQREHAVADHIPALFDALVASLERSAPVWVEPEAPLENPAVVEAAQQHAAARGAQGLEPADVIVEFRLLRQEIWHALGQQLTDSVPTGNVLAAQLLINDALDGAMGVGLQQFVDAIEEIKYDFLLTATHDIRNPLTALKGTAQFLHRQLGRAHPDLERIRAGFEQIDVQATRMMVLLAELLDVTRMRLGQFEIERTPIEMRTALAQVVTRLDPDVAARLRIRISAEAERTGQWDVGRLERVLENLLSNAVKYSPPKSPIDVQVRGTAERVNVMIRDHGRGLDATELAHLFDRFYRSPNVKDERVEGSGLGLYVVRGIVEAHGGTITATSPGPGQGCTVEFTLPWEPPPAADTPP